MKTECNAVLIAFSVFLLGGCGSPTVKYHPVNDSNDASLLGMPMFYMQGSWIVLSKQLDEDEKKNATSAGEKLGMQKPALLTVDELATLNVVVSAAPVMTSLYAIEPEDNLLASTTISTTFFDNSRLIKKIGFQYKNQTLQTVQAVSATAVSVAALLDVNSAEDKSLSLPVVLDVTTLEWCVQREIPGQNADSAWTFMLKPSGADCPRQGLTSQRQTKPLGAISKSDYFLDTSKKHTFPTSICRDAVLSIINGQRHKDFAIAVVDPEWVQAYTIPEKGSITMHSLCGADIVSENDGSNDYVAFQVVQDIFNKAKVIKDARDAQDAAKKE